MAEKEPHHLQPPVQCTDRAPDTENAMSTPIVPIALKENKSGMKYTLRQLQAKIDEAAEIAITERQQRVAHVSQVATRIDNIESETEKVAIKICQQLDSLKKQLHSMEDGHDQAKLQISLLQKTESATQSELIKLRSRVDEAQRDSIGVESAEEIKILPCKVQESVPCDPIQSKDFVRHLTMVKSETEEVKSVLEKRIEVLEKRLESVERNFTVEEIHQQLQRLQVESCRIENDVNSIKEDVKKHLEDIKQQMVQVMSLFSDSAAELGPTATAITKRQHFPSVSMPAMEVPIRHRRQAVPSLNLQGMSMAEASEANVLPDNLSETTTGIENRASRASSGYFSISSRPHSIVRSDSNTSVCTQRFSQFSLEEAFREEEENADQNTDKGLINSIAADPTEQVLLHVPSHNCCGSDRFFTPPTSPVSPSVQNQ